MIISQMRLKEKQLNDECRQLKKLIEITKPRSLDAFFATKNVLSNVSKPIELAKPVVASLEVVPKTEVSFVSETETEKNIEVVFNF